MKLLYKTSRVKKLCTDEKKAIKELGEYVADKLLRIIELLESALNLKDTQSGLRGIPRKYTKDFIETTGERYEYMSSALLDTKKINLPKEQFQYFFDFLKNNFEYRRTFLSPVTTGLKNYSILFLKGLMLNVIVDIWVVWFETKDELLLWHTIRYEQFLLQSDNTKKLFSSILS